MVVMVRRGWWPHGAIALATAMMPGLYWLGLPVNTDSRFLMPAIAPALLPLAFLFPRARRAELAVHVAYTIALLWLVVGARASLPAAVPWFMRGWLALDGLVTAPFLVAFAL